MDYDNICEICFCEYDNHCIELNCKHKFHIYCLKLSINKNYECPYCRTKIPNETIQNLYKCNAILKSGRNKGKQCSNNCKGNLYCGVHKNYIKDK